MFNTESLTPQAFGGEVINNALLILREGPVAWHFVDIVFQLFRDGVFERPTSDKALRVLQRNAYKALRRYCRRTNNQGEIVAIGRGLFSLRDRIEVADRQAKRGEMPEGLLPTDAERAKQGITEGRRGRPLQRARQGYAVAPSPDPVARARVPRPANCGHCRHIEYTGIKELTMESGFCNCENSGHIVVSPDFSCIHFSRRSQQQLEADFHRRDLLRIAVTKLNTITTYRRKRAL